ncbi:MAG: hypothetical protein WC782_10230 [Methylococcaceae bacterium]|jgi:hypothetical protein
MLKKTHMRDQAGARKIEDIMNHYHASAPNSTTVILMVVGVFLLLGGHG